MSQERKAVRDAIRAVIEQHYEGEVFTSRRVSADKLPGYINVFFVEGDSELAMQKLHTSAVVAVGFHITGSVSDDDLDAMADPITTAINYHRDWPAPIHGVVGAGFEYPDDEERQFSTIYIKFTVHYDEV